VRSFCTALKPPATPAAGGFGGRAASGRSRHTALDPGSHACTLPAAGATAAPDSRMALWRPDFNYTITRVTFYGEEVAMTLQLPAPDTRQLARSPLSLVVCQVRIEESPLLAEATTALRVQEMLSAEYPRLSALLPQRQQLIQQPDGSQIQQVDMGKRGYRLSTSDKTFHISLTADSFSLETTAYTTWNDDFQPRLTALVETVRELVRPVLETRLGLRYVNVIKGSAAAGRRLGNPTEFGDVISPWFLGPLGQSELGSATRDLDGRCVLALDEVAVLSARYGTVLAPDDELSFLLDFDAYRESNGKFDPGEMIETANGFNESIVRLFQHSITPAALAQLRKE
jgi:uncharacterized protein (TIGR04255 family)